jgi:hypothetical protein
MSGATDLEERLSTTLHAKARQVRPAAWPTTDDLVVSPLPARGAPARPGRRAWLAVAAVLVVAMIAVGLGVHDDSSSHAPVRSDDGAQHALDQIEQLVQAGTIFGQVGDGSATPAPTPISDAPLVSDGHPEVLYIGAEYCPYCAAERWALVLALSRFGQFSDLGSTTSASDDVEPDTSTFTFRGASYASDVLSFTGVEVQDREKQPLESLTPDEQAIQDRVDTNGSIPFLDIGGRDVLTGANYDVGVLQGKSMDEIADALSDPSSPISQAVVGAANQITSAICQVTGGLPASVCGATPGSTSSTTATTG